MSSTSTCKLQNQNRKWPNIHFLSCFSGLGQVQRSAEGWCPLFQCKSTTAGAPQGAGNDPLLPSSLYEHMDKHGGSKERPVGCGEKGHWSCWVEVGRSSRVVAQKGNFLKVQFTLDSRLFLPKNRRQSRWTQEGQREVKQAGPQKHTSCSGSLWGESGPGFSLHEMEEEGT